MTAFGWFQVHYIIVVLFFISPIAVLGCKSTKKFETDARADLVPRPSGPVSPQPSRSQIKPTAQTPPKHTPVEKTRVEKTDRGDEDTLANLQSLPDEPGTSTKDEKNGTTGAAKPEQNGSKKSSVKK